MSNDKEYDYESFKLRFVVYMQEHSLKVTPARLLILEEVFNTDDHFEIETLYLKMRNEGKKISKATLYSMIHILLSCKLAKRHMFAKDRTVYEKNFHKEKHDHLICIESGVVYEFYDEAIDEISERLQQKFGVKILRHTLTFYANCWNAEKKTFPE